MSEWIQIEHFTFSFDLRSEHDPVEPQRECTGHKARLEFGPSIVLHNPEMATHGGRHPA